jgi:hypothetical protein
MSLPNYSHVKYLWQPSMACVPGKNLWPSNGEKTREKSLGCSRGGGPAFQRKDAKAAKAQRDMNPGSLCGLCFLCAFASKRGDVVPRDDFRLNSSGSEWRSEAGDWRSAGRICRTVACAARCHSVLGPGSGRTLAVAPNRRGPRLSASLAKYCSYVYNQSTRIGGPRSECARIAAS